MRIYAAAVAACIAVCATPAVAQSPRELLASAAFTARDKATALARIEAALDAAEDILKRDPDNHEALLQRAVGIGYRGKLKRNRHDVQAARKGFEALVKANPRDAEAQLALAGWHLGAIIELGPIVARTVLGARKAQGMQALDRAVALAGGRAFIPAYASLTRIQLDPAAVAPARSLAEAAVESRVANPVDRVMQRNAATLLALLKGGNGKAAAAQAERLMPFGRFDS
ncbi:hypothetical protein [Allosphingosinicella indica]|uniref:Tetratricopeptide repeat protein n=1 Tax=Allosphingosinicella indica TaxID=941907 RepID=A0A1X7G0L2_9SPHN|nr:hypothetical protein [Allosphingosinicella indica]SMF61527.1 hypothetical protein SAMN06295910_0517 [Allosphingosinicella indica]